MSMPKSYFAKMEAWRREFDPESFERERKEQKRRRAENIERILAPLRIFLVFIFVPLFFMAMDHLLEKENPLMFNIISTQLQRTPIPELVRSISLRM